MHFYYAYFFFSISFLNYAQQISNDRYLQKRWPADEETLSLFEQAKERLAKNPNDEDGKKALTLLGERELYIPALNALTDHALEQHDFDRAFHLSYVGHLYGDQQSMYKHAYLLLNPHLCFQLKDADPRPLEIIAKNLLMHAAQPISLEMEEGQVSHIHFPCASRLLVAADNDSAFRAYQDGLAHSYMLERSLDNVDQETREKAENDARENDDIILGCCFIKRYLNQPEGSSDVKKGLDLVQYFVTVPFFNYHQFIRSGGYRAVQRLAQNIQKPDHARAAYLLGTMDYQRISFDDSIDLNQLEKNLIKGAAYEPTAYLMLAALSAEPGKKIKWLEELSKKIENVEPESRVPAFIALVRGFHTILHTSTGNENTIVHSIHRLIKHNAFTVMRDEIGANIELARELGMKLLQIRDKVILRGKSKERVDLCKIRETGLSLSQTAALMGDEPAAWALVEHSLSDASASSTNTILDEHLATAIINTQAQIEHGNPSTVSSEEFQRILTKINPIFLSPESSQALAYWYMYGVRGVIDPDERKGIRCLARVKEVGPIMCQLIEEGKINDPRACFEAAVLLHTSHSDTHVNERNLLFNKAILHADISLKKEIINYCLEHEPLVELATRAFNAYSNDLPKSIESPEELQNEFVYQKSCIDILMKWAVGKKYSDSPDISKRSKPAIMFLYELKRTNASDQGPWDKEDADTFDFLAYWAATQGYEPAFTALEVEFQEAKRDMVFVDRAVSFWEAWLKVYSKDVTKAAEIAQVRSKIDELSRVSLEKNEKGSPFILNCRTHYRLANMFIDRGDHNKAMEHIAVGQICANSEIHCQDTDELINKTDTLPRIEQAAREGQAWAQYTLAKIKTQRMEHILEMDVVDSGFFQEIQTIKDLLVRSDLYARSLTEPDALGLGEIEYLESAIAKRLFTKDGSKDEALKKRSEQALQNAVDKGYPKAHYAWAYNALAGQLGDGQQILERVVERLCFAADHRVMEAAMILKDIAKHGFDFIGQCQGNITAPLLQKVLDTLRMTGLPELKVTVPEKGTVAYGRYLLNRLENLEQAYDIFQKASGEGDVCAYIYLGIMHRDGICVQRSPQTADVYFARAIKESGQLTLNEQIMRTLNIADYALSGQLSDNTPLLADCARYRLQLIPHAKNERAACADALGLVETLENIIKKSTDPREHTLIFTSGIMKELATIASRTSSLQCKMRIAKICVEKFKRMSSLGLDESWLDAKKGEYVLLANALNPLDSLLGEIAIGKQPIEIWAQIDSEETTQLFTELQTLVAQGYRAQFQELLGMLQLCSGIFSRDAVKVKTGLAELDKAKENGDLRAEYMHALVNFFSMDLKDHGFSKELTKKTVNKAVALMLTPLFPDGRKIGLAELKKLAKKGYAPAACIVARSLVDQEEYKQGADHYRLALEKSPEIASYGLLHTMTLQHSIVTDADRDRIPELICAVKKSKEFNYMAPLFASYFKLVHQIGNLTDEQMADGILSAPDGLYHILNAARICKLLDSDSFLAKFNDWVEACEKKWKAEREVQQSLEADMQMLKVYSAYAILEYVYGTLHDERHILTMKKTIQTCCKILTENKLRLDAVPAIANLLHTVSEYGGLTGAEFIQNKDQIIIDLSKRKEKLMADIKWATALKNAYAPIAPKSLDL